MEHSSEDDWHPAEVLSPLCSDRKKAVGDSAGKDSTAAAQRCKQAIPLFFFFLFFFLLFFSFFFLKAE